VPLLLLAGALLEVGLFWCGIVRAHVLAASGRRFERRSTTHGTSILVLADSTGVGVAPNCLRNRSPGCSQPTSPTPTSST
jgi:hypothetical protein